MQWPNPRILCYKTSYSDMPSNGNSARSCCSLYSLNLGFTVFWLLVFAIMVIARDVVRIIICLCFWVVHVLVVILFRCVWTGVACGWVCGQGLSNGGLFSSSCMDWVVALSGLQCAVHMSCVCTSKCVTAFCVC